MNQVVLDRIFVELSVTRNLGDYNSVKAVAGYETNVFNEETIDDAYSRAWSVVESEVENKISEALS